MKAVIMILSLVLLASCSKEDVAQDAQAFGGRWYGEGNLSSTSMGTKECDKIAMDLEQTSSWIKVNMIEWRCAQITRSSGRQVTFDIHGNDLYYEGTYFGKIEEDHMTFMIFASGGAKSVYTLTYDRDHDNVLYQEKVYSNTGRKETMTVIGVLEH